jgi:2OG-Fe(II) oxygenase superfamily
MDLEALERGVGELSASYQHATPYPHIVLDDFLNGVAAKAAMAEFPLSEETHWRPYSHANERKFSQTEPATWGPTLQAILDLLNSDRFVHFLEALSGIDDLFPDGSLEGGGLHQTPRGGFLNIHADFTVHPGHQDWRRRVNLLLYLNEDWKADYGGELELWSTDMTHCERKVAPVGNRVVVFTTNADSFHGHPEPLTCPPGLDRRSLALYYFSKEDRPVVRSTEYRARPGDGARATLIIALDKYVLRAYDWSKRHLGISDSLIEPFLRRAERFRRKGKR